MFGAKHKFAGCSLLVLSDINKLHASDWHCWVYIPGVCWWKDAFSERVPIIIYIKQLFSCYCWTPILRLLNAVSLQLLTLTAASVFYGAPCLEGRCCKSCVIYKKKKKKLVLLSASFISTNLRDVQIDFGLKPYLPGTSSFTKLLACQHSPSLSSLPPPLLLHWADDVVFFALVFDCPPWEVPGSGCMWQASAWTRLSPPLFCLHGHAAWELQYPWQWRRCARGWLFKCCRQEDLGLSVCTSDVQRS